MISAVASGCKVCENILVFLLLLFQRTRLGARPFMTVI